MDRWIDGFQDADDLGGWIDGWTGSLEVDGKNLVDGQMDRISPLCG